MYGECGYLSIDSRLVDELRELTMYLSDLPGRYNINDDQASIHTIIPGEQLSQIGCGSRQTWVEINSRSPVSKVLLHHRQVLIAPPING